MPGSSAHLDPAHTAYPRRLRALAPRPPALYVSGALVEPARSVAIVGSRAASAEACATAHALAVHAASVGVQVVSGGALGVDAAAHRGALAAGGHTVVVLGTGLDVIYPDRHRGLFAQIVAAGGALVTAYPEGTPPRPGNFVRRNQVIAGLADLVVVVSASAGSGALHTARAAIRLGRPVAATPGTPGTQLLITSGAAAIATGADLDVVLAGGHRRPTRPAPSADGRRVLAALAAAGRPVALDQLADDDTLGLGFGRLTALLCELEADGWIIPIPGGAYVGRALSARTGSRIEEPVAANPTSTDDTAGRRKKVAPPPAVAPAPAVVAKPEAKIGAKVGKVAKVAAPEAKVGAKAAKPAKAKPKAKAKAKAAKAKVAKAKAKAEVAPDEVADGKANGKRNGKAAAAAVEAKAPAVVAKGGGKGRGRGKPPKMTAKERAAEQAEIDADERAHAAKPRKVKPGSALIVVESPAKARTIGKYLGAGYTVKASVGHVRDLPKSKIGVDVEHGFEPSYEVIDGKKKIVAEIRKAARENEQVYLASDPDREGEAIAWHIREEIAAVNPNIKRILIHEITKKGVAAALAKPLEIDIHKADAQQARRILDRLVGYEISPILWNKVQRGLSAGRVQSVAVRLVCEREDAIRAFVPEEYWSVEVSCKAGSPPPFDAKIWRWQGEKAAPKNQAEADAIAAELRAGDAIVASVEKKERRKRPQAPFITSRLQQDAARKHRFTAKRTMALAQRLYEGVELGDEGPTGLITYMRTDSTRISDDATAAVREHITATYGADYLPEAPPTYGNKERAQDAHEAIRPTLMEWTPERVKVALANHPEGVELTRLYTLIWQRFVASQMVPAVYDQTTIDLDRGAAVVRANGQILKFAGYTKVYEVSETDDEKAEAAEAADRLLPPLEVGDRVELTVVRPEQHFTQPPPRFTEASLVKELEDDGIGRPSTYASIMSTIVDRGYVEKKEGRFFPTELGILVNTLLVESFPRIVSVDFTAKMEADLDHVEEGNEDWRKLLGGFYDPFKDDLARARVEMRDVKREEIATDFVCEKCGKPMVIKWGRNGSFLACQGYPECRNTKEVVKNLDGTYEIVPEQTTDEVCETCGAPMTIKRGRFGSFLACTRYPDCKTTKPISLGVKCPKEGCGGFLAEKRSRRGKPFYGCSNWKKKECDFVSWDKPIPQPCPACNAKFVVKKENKRGVTLRCMTCDWRSGAVDEEEAGPA